MTLSRIQKSELTTQDGVCLRVIEHNVLNSSGTVLLVHGLGEHSARYDHVVQVLNRSGLNVARFDHRGHGVSPGSRGHVPSYEHFLDDVSLVAQNIIAADPFQKITLYGHSMGGGIVANWCLRRFDDSWSDNIVGAVLSAPWFRLTAPVPDWKVFLLKNLSQVVPTLGIPTNIRVQQTCRSEDAIERFKKDELNHQRITVKTAIECYTAGNWALKNASNCKVPILAIHGSADRITSPEATREFCAAVPNARFVPLYDLIHEPHHDPKWREVVYHVTEWVLKRYQFSYAA